MNSKKPYRKSKEGLVPREGQQGFLCRRNESASYPSLIINKMGANENEAMEYLVDILLEAFLNIKKNEKFK